MNYFYIKNFKLSKDSRVFIIAEIGVNHNGSINKAIKLVDLAKIAGADAVKFQTFSADQVTLKKTQLVNYQKKNLKKNISQYSMLKKLELNKEDFVKLKNYCDHKNIIFISTPYNFDDIDFLNTIDIDCFKLSSMHLTETPILKYISKFNKPIICSTGMSTIDDIKKSHKIFYESKNSKIIYLQCTSNYPTNIKECNINVISTFKKTFPNNFIGYSDHSTNNISAIAAVALGSKVIEKHFTFNTKLIGPDHSSSYNPTMFGKYVRDIRLCELSLGSNKKSLSSNEIKNIKQMRRCLVLKKNVKINETLNIKDVAFKRPAKGINPNKLELYLGKKFKRNLSKDHILKPTDFF